MSIKQQGTETEQEFLKLLGNRGYWATFIPPDNTGSQPCDIIAAKANTIYLIDVKDCHSARFPLTRVEDNQFLSMQKMLKINNYAICIFALKYKDKWYQLDFQEIDFTQKSIKIKSLEEICES